ncbi:MAG: AI-2E family transporter [Firmicutes bacterium]|nr:AI-2E family transporter [Alicyclobacillaceae bacterium]MCL6496629.1 AI-2E family transporter [Bacillota bacterium]
MAAAAGWVAWVARPVLTPFVFALVLTYLLAPSVDFFHRHGLPRSVAVLVVYAGLGLAVAVVVLYLTPLLVQQATTLIRSLPTWAQVAEQAWARGIYHVHRAPIPAALRGALALATQHLQNQLYALLRRVVGALFGLVPGVISLVVAPVLAFYFLKDLDRIRARFWAVVPVDWHPAVFKLGLDVDAALGGYVRGQLVVALVVGLLAGLWVAWLKIPLAALIGAVAALTDVIPYVGPVVGAVPAVLIALAVSPWKALWVVLGFMAIHQLEGTVIGPKVVGDSVGLHPLVVVLAILAGGEAGGVAGLLLAVPVAAVLKVGIGHLYRRLAVGTVLPEDLGRALPERAGADLTAFQPNP